MTITGFTGSNITKASEIITVNNNKCMKKQVKIDENYFLVAHEANSNVAVEVTKDVSHIIIVDVSGSMSYDLPEIRKNLKNKISNMVKPNDVVSIIWFSGRNDAGILKEEVQVNSLKQLNDLNDAIDRFLKPIGMTAFAKPIELASDIIDRISINKPQLAHSLMFMSDGYNNDVPFTNVISALNKISPKLASSVVVEYGWNADSRRLTEMAGILGGEKISCSGLEEYDVVIGNGLNKSLKGGKKTLVDITDKYLYDFAFSVADGSVLLYNIVNNQILVGSDVKEVYYFTSKELESATYSELHDVTPLYAGIYLLSDALKNDDAEKLFYILGDNHYYKMLANAFGKQKLNAFKSAIKDCVGDVAKRFPDGGGRQTITKVSDDAYCLMNLIGDLGNLENCLFYPNHDSFEYNRIGRKKVATGSVLTDADKQRLTEAKNVDEAAKILKELEESKVDVKFVNSNPNRGYSLTDLVWNEKRANLSVLIKIDGEVMLPKNKFGIDNVVSYKFNTFTLIKDGIVNVEKLPLNYTKELADLLFNNKVNFEDELNIKGNGDIDSHYIIVDLSSLPIINRGMVKSVSANALAKQEWELNKLQGEKKVYDFYRKQLFPKESKSFVELLGQECADWLKEVGVTDFNGFAPKVVSVESTDFYMSVILETKIKGLSSLPKVDDVLAKIVAKKELKLGDYVMADAIAKYQAQTESDLFKSLSEDQQKGILKTYLETKSTILNKQKRKIMQQIAQIKFSLILSKKWFTEFKTFDENKLALTLDGQTLDFTFDLCEKEEKI